MSYKISGHETFACRYFWLKKGFDFLLQENSFSDDNAVVNLGVGKNMVNSIKHWTKVFGFSSINGQAVTIKNIFKDDGYDPYLEDINTLWLLHYFLIKGKEASIYDLFFNQFNPRTEFSLNGFEYFIKLKFDEEVFTYSPNSLESDLKVFQAMYIRPAKTIKSLEDEFSGLFQELKLFDYVNKDQVLINSNSSKTISPYIALFLLLDQHKESSSISFNSVLNNDNSLGKIFCLNQTALYELITRITDEFKFVTFKEDAGVREIQIKTEVRLNGEDLLKDYYGKS